MQRLTDIRLHGDLGKVVGENWKLAVSSVSEAVRAIETLSQRKLYRYLAENDKTGIRYQVLLNGRSFQSEKPLSIEDKESIKNSELVIPQKNLKTIDIVPVLEGADGNTGLLIAGILLIIVGIIFAFIPGTQGLAGYAIVAGIGLLAAGVVGLLSKPPEFDDFREIQGGGRPSYLFNGPQNTTREGGPVPVGYGRMLIGSQVISASYKITHRAADNQPLTS